MLSSFAGNSKPFVGRQIATYVAILCGRAAVTGEKGDRLRRFGRFPSWIGFCLALAERDGALVVTNSSKGKPMNRKLSPIAAFMAIAALGLVACDNPGATAQDKTNQAQADADKAAAQARDDAEKKTKSAQADADKKIADAQADFAKAREDYRHTVQTNLDDVNKKIAELDAKANTATGKAKTDLSTKLTELHTQRDAFAAEFKKLDTSTASTWDATKQRLDKSWSDLKAAVDHAS